MNESAEQIRQLLTSGTGYCVSRHVYRDCSMDVKYKGKKYGVLGQLTRYKIRSDNQTFEYEYKMFGPFNAIFTKLHEKHTIAAYDDNNVKVSETTTAVPVQIRHALDAAVEISDRTRRMIKINGLLRQK